MWPRQLLGYGRLETEALVALLCTLYQEAWGWLINSFLPGLKLNRSAWKKRYEPGRTAYQRLILKAGSTKPAC
jgi:hypothetical protein